MTQRVSDEHVQKILLDARAEIATLRAKLAAVCRAGETLASEVLDICEDPYCDGPRCLACFAMKAAIAAADVVEADDLRRALADPVAVAKRIEDAETYTPVLDKKEPK
jgi:hypothetical protein